ncbi:hypothetical protein SERN_1938 [Serinibacter arcticus]|uniref:Uncharacterized protein n=1 Tax=Serinibacter arcticus TaxID=1655435 RepID=A0A4Z1DXC2_9MICO|nr:hypothetical protein SERN_1938 [Serinibacter arcticus]
MLPHPPWGEATDCRPPCRCRRQSWGGPYGRPRWRRALSPSGWCGGRVATER